MRFESGRHRTAENLLRTKHVVAAGLFAGDAGSTPAASTLRLTGYAWQATLENREITSCLELHQQFLEWIFAETQPGFIQRTL